MCIFVVHVKKFDGFINSMDDPDIFKNDGTACDFWFVNVDWF